MQNNNERLGTGLAVILILWFGAAAEARSEDLKLIVQITIDQMRGNTPLRFSRRFLHGRDSGLRLLLEKGVVYTNAFYTSSAAWTAPGHATLFTGGDVKEHGLPGNEWYDAATGRLVYCVEDSDHTVLGSPPQPQSGTSPRNVTMSTIGDELRIASGLQGRVFAVSLKDRGAIIPGGRLGKAFWYSEKTGEFVTSTFYYDEYPAWVKRWNRRKPAQRWRKKEWELLLPASAYWNGDADDRYWERPPGGMDRTFPHSFARLDKDDYFSGLRYTPMGDQLTLEFVKALVENERIGRSETTDLLSVSFSASDYIGHAFGPNSLEFEDNLLRLDRTLADFFAFLDRAVGLEHTVIVLSADHGVADAPEYAKSLGLDAGRLDPHGIVELTNAALQGRFDVAEPLVLGFSNLSFYLDTLTIQALGLNVGQVEEALVDELTRIPGIALAVSRASLKDNRTPRDPLWLMLHRAYHPVRSGNVLIAQAHGWYLAREVYEHAAMHGSPYDYDSHVPLIFLVPGVAPRQISRRVGPEDVAPTLASILGIRPPTGSTGQVLNEAVPIRESD